MRRHLYWKVDTDNVLTIYGTGDMYNYDSSNKAPWRNLDPALTTLVLEEGMTSIGSIAFYYCSDFTGSLTIPNSVTSIGENAFDGCAGFTGSLTIPNGVTSIGTCAFNGCSGFTDVFFYREECPEIGSNVFSGLNNAKFHVPMIWESVNSNIPSGKLEKMPTYVGQQTTDNSHHPQMPMAKSQ